MIEGVCYTILDDFSKEIWPTKFVAIPRVGDYVAARSGKRLMVCAISHGETSSGTPFIRIELHKNVKRVKLKKFNIRVEISWICPECGHENKNEWSASPYNAIADDGADEMCENCKEFFEMNFYDD